MALIKRILLFLLSIIFTIFLLIGATTSYAKVEYDARTPEPKKINNLMSNLIESDLISISEGEAKIEVIFDCPSGKVKID